MGIFCQKVFNDFLIKKKSMGTGEIEQCKCFSLSESSHVCESAPGYE